MSDNRFHDNLPSSEFLSQKPASSSPGAPFGSGSLQTDVSSSRESWSGAWAFILAAAGSAVGLGNLWRFPYLAAKYGGGTFLIVYLVLVFTLGASLLLQDIVLGRYTKLSVIGAFASKGKGFGAIGILAAAVPFIILPYYCIIGGWVGKWAIAYIGGETESLADGGTYFSDFISGGESFFWMSLFAIIVLVVVAMGVKGGIEKINLVLMPALIILAIGITVYTIFLPGALDGLAFFFVPDFSKMSVELVLAAIGQCFFSLSIAMAIMVTYGSYVAKTESLTQSVTRIVGFDLGVSLLAGMMIVPAAFAALGSADAVAGNSGPSLMFIILPGVFESMGAAAPFVGFIFFLLTLFAAITSGISIAEACVSVVLDGLHLSRIQASTVVGIYALVVGAFVNMGYNVLSVIEPIGANTTLLDLFDFLSNTLLMPVVAIATCVFVGWILKPETLIAEVRLSSKFKLAGAWSVMVKYLAPLLVCVVLVIYLAAQFGLVSL